MTFIEAAAEVLRKAGKPLHYKEITELAIAGNLLSHVGKTPEVTMSHRLTSAIKKDDKEVPIVKVKPGVFALREWEGKKGKRGSAAAPAEAPSEDEAAASDDESGGLGVNALEIEAALRGAQQQAARDEDDEDEEASATGDRETPVTGAEALRADLAASGAELFDDEEDDDQPILAPLSQPGGAESAQQQGEGGRRRRRRRRRGRGGSQAEASAQGDRFSSPRLGGEPRFAHGGRAASPVVTERFPSGAGPETQPRGDGVAQAGPVGAVEGDAGLAEGREPYAAPRPVVRDRQQIMAGGQPTGIDIPLGEGDELASSRRPRASCSRRSTGTPGLSRSEPWPKR